MGSRLWLAAALAVIALTLTPSSVAARASEDAAVKLPASFPAAGEILRTQVTVRAEPDPNAKVVRVLKQFRPTDFRLQIVLALEARRGTDGRWWYKLSLPQRPNGQRGWVRASSVGVKPVGNRVVVYRGARRLEVRRIADGKLLFRTVVAVGKPGAETPLGRNFYVTSRFVPLNTFLGVFALETSAYSRLTDWPGGGVAGIHGTYLTELLGQAVSSGCVRLSNEAILRVKKLAPLGTPIDILP